jgi:K+-transporting ATPase ATPase C chain
LWSAVLAKQRLCSTTRAATLSRRAHRHPHRPKGKLMSFAASSRQVLAGLRVLIALTLLTGVLYPLAVFGVAQVTMPGKANGSQVTVAGKVVGSSLIGQNFTGAQWFQPRPSAAGDDGYDTLSSSASNLGPNNPDLVKAIQQRRAAYAKLNGVAPSAVPADALTASGSGLDPHISPANAKLQVARVARVRGLDPAKVAALVKANTQGRTLGFLGDPRVNVLELNIALMKLAS